MFMSPLSFECINKRICVLLFILLPGLFSTLQSIAANTPLNCENSKAVVEVQNGVFVRPGSYGIIFEDKNIANIGFIVGEQAIAVIDTGGSINEGKQLICQIRKVSKLPIRYVINTHVHPDHTLGNSAFNDPNITFIGHKNLTHAMGVLSKTYLSRYNEKTGENIPEKSIILPQTTVIDELEIDLGNRTLTLIATQRAHTNNDLMVYDKKTQTYWLSDLLFHKHIPVIGKSGSVGGWLDVIKNLKNKSIKNVIPGHGPLIINWDETANNQIRYLTQLRDDIRENISTDADLTEAMETIGLNETTKWKMFSHYHKRNISYIFSELEWE